MHTKVRNNDLGAEVADATFTVKSDTHSAYVCSTVAAAVKNLRNKLKLRSGKPGRDGHRHSQILSNHEVTSSQIVYFAYLVQPSVVANQQRKQAMHCEMLCDKYYETTMNFNLSAEWCIRARCCVWPWNEIGSHHFFQLHTHTQRTLIDDQFLCDFGNQYFCRYFFAISSNFCNFYFRVWRNNRSFRTMKVTWCTTPRSVLMRRVTRALKR